MFPLPTDISRRMWERKDWRISFLAVLLIFCLRTCHVGALVMPKAVTKLAPRVVLPTLPKVYVYDHCPFCVRVRLALGLKNIKIETVFLANDDVNTPTNLVGKKVVPIFDWSSGGIAPMAESLDIIKRIDEDVKFGSALFKPATGTFEPWLKLAKEANGLAQRPRYMMSPTLPEFATADARDTFVKNHPLGTFTKADWKALDGTRRWQLYSESYDLSLKQLDTISANLADLDKMIHSDCFAVETGLSYDDIDLWSRLRSVTLIKGVVWPDKLKRYMDNLSELGDVPLMWSLQC